MLPLTHHLLTPPHLHDTLPASPPWLPPQLASQRLSFEQALWLLTQANIHELGLLARQVQLAYHPPEAPLTFVIDRNVNYTNICNVDCMFCAFYRHADAPDAYVLPYEVIASKAQALLDANGTQFLLQGGVNPNLPFDYYTDLLSRLKHDFPTLTLHAFSTSEISFMATLTGQSVRWVLEQLISAGLDSIPGAGAEILHDDVRRKISPNKVDTDDWLGVMATAHELGLKTTATMMIGTVEQPHHIVDHLMRLRDLQDRTRGFTAFIPWSFQPDNTQLAKLPTHKLATGLDFIKTVAIARLVLDNIPNIQSSWLTQGMKLCQVALAYGANDMGGLVLEENVVTEAGIKHETHTPDEVVALAKQLGKQAAQRNTQYQVLRLLS